MPSIFAVLGWVLGTFSLLSLIRSFKFANLYGPVADCVNTYSLFVNTAVGILFGFVPKDWGEIDNIESHLIILLAIYLFAASRAETRGGHHGVPVNIALCTTNLIFLSTLAIIPAFMSDQIPGKLFVVFWLGSALLVTGFAIRSVIVGSGAVPKNKIFVTELAAILTLVAVIIAINYTVFAP